jgi:hypothetical protein
MPCHFYTAHFTRCTNNVRGGGDYCGVHRAKAERLGARPDDTMCHCVRWIDGRDQWCGGERLPGQDICHYHSVRVENREANAAAARAQQELEHRVLTEYLQGPIRRELPDWRAVTRDCRRRMHLPREHAEHLPDRVAETVARRFFMRTTNDMGAVFTDYWVDLWRAEHGLPQMPGEAVAWMGEEIPQAAPLPQGQMARLARDAQNVHTAQVSKQTNGNLEILLEATPTTPGDTLNTLTRWWMFRPCPKFEEYWRVMEDVHHWYHARTCKKTNDQLYKRALEGLVEKILLATDGGGTDADELFEELVKRLWEECSEAVGMCCEGHLARLANVLVGFDEAFKPPVPVGEILQQKMAAIAELKVSPKHKLQRAVELMDELNIPAADRAPWLEAMEE